MAYAISRNKKLANLVKKRAGYKCQICGLPGFEKENGEVYGEAHYIRELAKKDYAVPGNLICVCANATVKFIVARVMFLSREEPER